MPSDQVIAALLGPWGVTVGAILLVVYLGRRYTVTVAERLAEKNARIAKLEGLVDVATAGWSAQTAANAQGAEAQERTAIAVEAIVSDLKRASRARR